MTIHTNHGIIEITKNLDYQLTLIDGQKVRTRDLLKGDMFAANGVWNTVKKIILTPTDES